MALSPAEGRARAAANAAPRFEPYAGSKNRRRQFLVAIAGSEPRRSATHEPSPVDLKKQNRVQEEAQRQYHAQAEK